jgi:hypothetical protein
MLSLDQFQIYVWFFIIVGWVGVLIIAVSVIRELIKLFSGGNL